MKKLEKLELFVKSRRRKSNKICSLNKKEIDKIKDDSTIAYNLDYVRINNAKFWSEDGLFLIGEPTM